MSIGRRIERKIRLRQDGKHRTAQKEYATKRSKYSQHRCTNTMIQHHRSYISKTSLPRPPPISLPLLSPNTKPPRLHSTIPTFLLIPHPLKPLPVPLPNNLQRLKRIRTVRRPQTREIPPPVNNSHKSPQHTPANHIKHIMPVILQSANRNQRRADQRRETHQNSQVRCSRAQAVRLSGEEET